MQQHVYTEHTNTGLTKGGVGKDAIATSVAASSSVDTTVTVPNDTNSTQKFLSDSAAVSPRRSLKRKDSNMSDAEVACSAVRLTKRRLRGKQTMPDAYITVAPLPVRLGESAPSFLPINYKHKDGDDFFKHLITNTDLEF